MRLVVKKERRKVLINIIGDSISNKHTNRLATKVLSRIVRTIHIPIAYCKWQLKIIDGSRNSEAGKG